MNSFKALADGTYATKRELPLAATADKAGVVKAIPSGDTEPTVYAELHLLKDDTAYIQVGSKNDFGVFKVGDGINVTDGVISVSQGTQGPKGDKGDTGEQGPKGDAGVNGKNGSLIYTFSGNPDANTGVDGDMAVKTTTGDVFMKESGAWVKKGNIQGPQGPKGDAGPKGDVGLTGPQGPAGTVDTTQFYTKAQTDAAITAAINKITDGDGVSY